MRGLQQIAWKADGHRDYDSDYEFRCMSKELKLKTKIPTIT